VAFCEVSRSAVRISLVTDRDAYTLHTRSQIKIYRKIMLGRRVVVGGMIAGGTTVATAAIVGHHVAKKQFQRMERRRAW